MVLLNEHVVKLFDIFMFMHIDHCWSRPCSGKLLFTLGRESSLIKVLRISGCWVPSPKWEMSANANANAMHCTAEEGEAESST